MVENDEDTVGPGSENVVTLGREMAAALAAEHRHAPPGPSPVADIEYPDGSGDLWRWVERPQDAALSAFVRAYSAADRPSWTITRASLSMDDLYTVLLFAKRRAFAAIRTNESQAVVESFDAVSAIDIERVDWRDVFVTATLAAYAASCVGVPAATLAAAAIDRADQRVSRDPVRSHR